MATTSRCPWAVRFGGLATRCFLDADHPLGNEHLHRGRGLEDCPTIIHWFAGDRREFVTERDDAWSWEVGS